MPPSEATALSQIIPAVSAVVSLCSFIGVTVFAVAKYRSDRLSQKIAYLQTQKTYFDDLKKWADEISDLQSEAIHLCDLDPQRADGESFFSRRHRLRIKISSMIDRGRWFFPNIRTEELGHGKPKAFRGYRHVVLDSLVNFYRLMGKIDYAVAGHNTDIRLRLSDCKKIFVSEIQNVLDPNSRQNEFESITKEARKN